MRIGILLLLSFVALLALVYGVLTVRRDPAVGVTATLVGAALAFCLGMVIP